MGIMIFTIEILRLTDLLLATKTGEEIINNITGLTSHDVIYNPYKTRQALIKHHDKLIEEFKAHGIIIY